MSLLFLHTRYFSFFFALAFSFFCADIEAVAQEKSSIETSGDVIQVGLPLLALGVEVWRKDKQGIKQFAFVSLTNFALTQGLKIGINKKRPKGPRTDSFPSGHTSMATQGSTFIWRRYGWKYGVPASVAAAYVGFTRIEAEKHDLIDVIAGAIIGSGSALLFARPVLEGKAFVEPVISTNAIGFHVQFNF